MTTVINLPLAEEISTFLTQLYGLKIDSSATNELGNDTIAATGQYVDEEGALRGVICCDLAGAAKLGAGLTQIPQGAVDDVMESGELPDNIAENLSEVFNILVNLFPEIKDSRLVLGEVKFGAGAADCLTGKTIASRLDAEIDIQRYGKGVVSLLTVES